VPQAGRVTSVNPDGTVDILLDTLVPLSNVTVLAPASGPDRDRFKPPRRRSLVVVQWLYGTKEEPFVLGVLPRRTRTPKPPTTKNAERDLHPSGMHRTFHDNGDVEVRYADGSYVTIGALSEPTEDHTGQKRESQDGNPMQDLPPVDNPKPAPFQVNVKLADGTKIAIKDGAMTVELPSDLTVKAAGDVRIESQGQAIVKAPNVSVEGASVVDVKGGIIRHNNGAMPMARVGDDVLIPSPIPFSPSVGKITSGNSSVLA
jgi:hypothetical protein